MTEAIAWFILIGCPIIMVLMLISRYFSVKWHNEFVEEELRRRENAEG